MNQINKIEYTFVTNGVQNQAFQTSKCNINSQNNNRIQIFLPFNSRYHALHFVQALLVIMTNEGPFLLVRNVLASFG